MATNTQNRNSNNGTRVTARRASGNGGKSAFSWGDGNGGAIVGAALAGVAIGFAANYGRKFLVQSMSGISGDWDEVLATEHDMTLAIFDKMLATDENQTWKRGMLLMQLEHALDKHAHEEEMVVYPALREANQTSDAEHLNEEHGQIKTYIYELHQMGPEAPAWLETVRQFRDLVREHAKMEEEQVFPRFKRGLTEEQNTKVTKLVNRDGFWQA